MKLHAYDELVELLASAPGLASFHLSEESRTRAWELAKRERDGNLTEEERQELETFSQLEHVVRLAKARALSPIAA
ncbi:hypothetical protein [Armatimonas rosea]|uniref:Uncharacterized protein n=1 Tax=Armatimonas rosea TaxID=685828 RepID=A0A7W9SPB9_ARMRO|nr:hypothetical protein [Armatimonas rosea]MBB6049573.1 hypothetical protein [Armatimonas rosea]